MKLTALGMTMGALALSTLGAQAQMTNDSSTSTTSSTTMGTGAMTGTMDSTGSMPGGSMAGTMGTTMAPTPVTGTVTRYYVDQAGFVSAMDVQTADGTKMVQFSPSMAQRLTSTFPVGSTINGYVMTSGMGSMMSTQLVGTGTSMPAPGMMMPSTVTDLDILRSTPYVMLGSKEMGFRGKLTGYVADPNNGEILALILNRDTLVRIPVQNRLAQASTAPEGVRDLLRGAVVDVRGMDEAPRYGVVSPYSRRIVASGITVDGRTLGTFGFGRVDLNPHSALIKSNLFGGMAAKDASEMNAMNMGYMPYMAPGADSPMNAGGTTTGGDTMSGGMAGGAGTGSMGSGTPGTGAGTTTPAS